MNEMRDFAVQLADGLDQVGVAFRKDHGSIPMSAHLVRFPEDGPPQVIFVDVERLGNTKEELGNALREMSAAMGARYVIFQNEAWGSIAAEKDDQTAVGAWIGSGRSLEHYPDRKEFLIITADGPDLNLMISREVAPDGSVGEPVRMEDTIAGALTNLSGNMGAN